MECLLFHLFSFLSVRVWLCSAWASWAWVPVPCLAFFLLWCSVLLFSSVLPLSLTFILTLHSPNLTSVPRTFKPAQWTKGPVKTPTFLFSVNFHVKTHSDINPRNFSINIILSVLQCSYSVATFSAFLYIPHQSIHSPFPTPWRRCTYYGDLQGTASGSLCLSWGRRSSCSSHSPSRRRSCGTAPLACSCLPYGHRRKCRCCSCPRGKPPPSRCRGLSRSETSKL